jgi:hypothetical protein
MLLNRGRRARKRLSATFRPGVEALEERSLLDSGLAPNARFVAQLYRDLLHREPDQSGLAQWTARLDQGTTRADVVQGILQSPEYRTRQIEDLYVALLGRSADKEGMKVFTALLSTGGAAEEVEAAILGSPEYAQRAGTNNAAFAQALYRDVLGRDVDPTGAVAVAAALVRGMPHDRVAAAVLNSPEARQQLVQGYYQRFLGRAADAGGMSGLVGALAHGVSQEAVILTFTASDEYFARLSASSENDMTPPIDQPGTPDAPERPGPTPPDDAWPGYDWVRQQLAVRTEDQWRTVWAEMQGDCPKELPPVDFTENMVIAVFLGARPSSGYTVDITEIRGVGNGLEVWVHETRPRPEDLVLAVITYPSDFVIVPPVDGEVRFIDL